MTFLIAGIAGLLAYGFTSFILFGGPLHAFALLTIWRDRLGLVYWPMLLLVAMGIAVLLTKHCLRIGMPRILVPALFIVISMSLSTFMVGGLATMQRDTIVETFEPDVEIRSSIFASFRNAPQDFQFFLHGAALKNCKPYAWSYREMHFYELPPNVAVNVLPRSWIKQCNIQRTR